MFYSLIARKMRSYPLPTRCTLSSFATCAILASAFAPRIAQAHVGLDSPNGGESLTAGSTFPIGWTNLISHNTLGWNLWYSTESEEGPWIDIISGIAPGEQVDGSTRSFNWLVPNLADDTAWVRVQQENGGDSYFDVSDASFSIIGTTRATDFNGDGSVDAADLTNWSAGYGKASEALSIDGDADGDGDVDGNDFVAWQRDAQPVVATSTAIPEPPPLALVAISGIFLAVTRARV